ncbi:ABC transporter substrate-binding protein [Herbiconiux sp. L3-i23]|uniref:ABC transporter substrate-binding protein n=1 Tax=Herbiconiux sp. L3-i23 TaxID=2905871 RepID=UPI00206D25E9|nr:ABC transporter substrate-binding protein [Herbiconiux sp. L3-i23]BDI23824.1 hypothetical protein L3i23_26000 [Herbiconiux sp. L3-i23]
MRQSRSAHALPFLVLGVIAALTACYAPVAAAPEPTPTRTAVVPYGDGVLTIGTLTSTTGALAADGAAQIAGVEAAVRAINEAGGVAGSAVRVFHRDVGDPATATLETSFAELTAKGVDVVIGPADASLLARTLPLAAAARVAVLSLTSAAETDDEADPSAPVVRVLPGPSVAGDAVAVELGDDTAVLVPVDDRGAELVEGAVTARGALGVDADASTVVEMTRGPARIASQSADADTVVVAGDAADDIAGAVASLLAAGVPSSRILIAGAVPDLTAVAAAAEGVRILGSGSVPNDAFGATLLAMDPALSSSALSSIAVTSTALAAEAYDATVLAALAAVTAGDDGGESVVAALPAASTTWIPCASYAECLSVLQTEDDIDYQGVSGPFDFDEQGRASSAALPLFTVAADGRPVYERAVLVRAASSM